MEFTDHRIESKPVSRRLASTLREGIKGARVHPARAMRLVGRLLVFLLVVSACSLESDETVGNSSSPNGPPVEEELREADPQDWGVASKLADFVSETFGRESEPDGESERIWNSDSSYEGEWVGGKPNGQGIMVYGIWESRRYGVARGTRYEGDFREGKPNGEGIRTWPSGKHYVGEYREGWPHGHGVEFWPDGRRYEGAWRNGTKTGRGVEIAPQRWRYEGEWLNGSRHGQGVEIWNDGLSYEGGWNHGLKHGWGVETTPDGSRIEGEWRNGAQVGRGGTPD